MVVVVIAIIWAAALLPPLIRSRLEGNPVDSIGRFNRHLRVLRSTTPAASALAGSAYSATMPQIWVSEARRLSLQRRRRTIAKSLFITAAATFVAGLLPDMQMFLVAHVLIDILLVGYLVMLAQARRQRAERQIMADFELLRREPLAAEGAQDLHQAAL